MILGREEGRWGGGRTLLPHALDKVAMAAAIEEG